MQRLRTAQLNFDFFEDTPAGLFHTTRPLRKHRSCNDVLQRLSYVRRFFPEFGSRCIRVGLTRVASGMAVPGGNEIWFNPREISYHAIAHEFIHLLQGQYGIPSGERACDLFSMGRHWTLNDMAPYYLRLPKKMHDGEGRIAAAFARRIYDVAQRALELRRNGLRNYIAFFEKTLTSGEAIGLPPEGVRAAGLPGEKPVADL